MLQRLHDIVIKTLFLNNKHASGCIVTHLSVCLFVCLSVSQHDFGPTCDRSLNQHWLMFINRLSLLRYFIVLTEIWLPWRLNNETFQLRYIILRLQILNTFLYFNVSCFKFVFILRC